MKAIRTSERFLFVFWVSFQCLVFAQDDNNAESCPLTCLNDSVCKSGDANFEGMPTDSQGEALDMHKETTMEGYHCECPEGFTGMTCSVIYESCADEATDHVCYHGGRCVRGVLDAFDNLQYHCDCSNAIDDGIYYAGTYCEHPSMTVCDPDKHTFCVNNGECVVTPAGGEPPCDCEAEFTGAHCEYSLSETPRCTQTCINGGTCQIGIPHHASPSTPTQDFYNMTYCLCPERYNGQQCELDSEPCGEHVCFHGATCNADLTCDCTASGKPGNGFAGQFCQYAATDFCSDGKKFCVNGGNCVEENGNAECICLDGWEGPACDIVTESAASQECLLECQNGGKCQTGVVDGTLLGLESELDHLGSTPNQDKKHCDCPKGYLGKHCETPVQECGDAGEHICLHGSTCRRDDEGESGEWTCDCEEAFTPDRKYAGKFCQHHHTTTCTNDGISGIYEGPSNFAFCVNDGLCIDMVEYGETHTGCSCPEEYTGLHCELTKSYKSRTQQSGSATDASGQVGDFVVLLFTTIFLIVSVVLIAVGSVVMYRTPGRMEKNKLFIEKSHMEKNRLFNDKSHQEDEPLRCTMEEVGFVDEAELEDVFLS